MEPQKKILDGYQAVMPSYKGILRDREIEGVIEYIKSLKYIYLYKLTIIM